jgi:hypothetical protein
VSEEGFLARWSRRKRAAEAGRDTAEPMRGDAPVVPPAGAAAAQEPPAFVPPTALSSPPRVAPAVPVPPVGAPQGAGASLQAPAEPPFDISSLPAIESLTAASDIRAFLRKEVPEALKRAALRRAWSLDPAIRDFVGPADYAWDYNAPDGVPGGALELLGDVREMLAQVFGPDTPSEQAEGADETRDAAPDAEPAPVVPAPVEPAVASAPPPAIATPAADPAPEPPVATVVRRHGSALPS